jgi:hypothetical protein
MFKVRWNAAYASANYGRSCIAVFGFFSAPTILGNYGSVVYLVWPCPTPLLGVFLKIAKSDSVCLSVCPHGTTQLPLDGFDI